MSWTHRERVLAALNHEEADRVPIDLGSTFVSGIIIAAYDRLKEYLGLTHETEIQSESQRLAQPDESVLERFGVDAQFLRFDGYETERKIDHNTWFDEWGITWQRAPGGQFMPIDGPFLDQEPDIEKLESWEWPDPDNPARYRGLKEAAAAQRAESDRFIILQASTLAACQAQWQRGFAIWLKNLYRHPEYAARQMDLITDTAVGIIHRQLDECGPNVDAVLVGDDMGIQTGPMYSPAIYRELVKPRHARMVQAIKEHDVKVIFHSCGAVHDFVGDIIDIGADVLNPVQVSAKDMDPVTLKEEFGDRIAFWGGVDTQRLLPFGTAEEVAAETRRIIDILGKGGGYVLNSVHCLEPEVPPENIVAMFDVGVEHRYAKPA